MEYQKYCMSTTPDLAKANQIFQSSVVSKFTPEAYNTLRRYMATMPDMKNVINLQLRAQKFTSAGVTVARKAVGEHGDFREKIGILAVRGKDLSNLLLSSHKRNAHSIRFAFLLFLSGGIQSICDGQGDKLL